MAGLVPAISFGEHERMTERLVIDRVGHRGDGVADGADGPLFVPYTLPGETVEVEAMPGLPDRRHLLRVIEPSPGRIAPICPHFGVCGGCALQHWTDESYRAWKRGLVVTALTQAGIEASVAQLIDAHGEGRRRAVLHARRGNRDIVEVGFAAMRAHMIIPIDRCPVLAPGLERAIETAWAIADILEPLGKPLDIHATATGNGIDIDIRGSGPLDPGRTAALAQLAEKRRLARITRHGEIVIQRQAPAIGMGRATLVLPPGSFLQATQAGEEELARLVLRHAARAKKIADLFAGVGPFTLRLAETARVTAVDNDQPALEALARAARAPGLKPVETIRRDLFRRPMTAQELAGCDTVVFDPPRQGAEAQSRELAKSNVLAVVAVSCNAATFARDARILIDGGYTLRDVTPVDQFRYTAHVEIVATFTR
jgi:23S rRNA (uracil1939-C5)-methyltransferase